MQLDLENDLKRRFWIVLDTTMAPATPKLDSGTIVQYAGLSNMYAAYQLSP